MSKKTLEGVYYELADNGYHKHRNAQITCKPAQYEPELQKTTQLSIINERIHRESAQEKSTQKQQHQKVNQMFEKEEINSIHCAESQMADSVNLKGNKVKKQLSKSTQQEGLPKKGILKRSLDQKQAERRVSPEFSKSDNDGDHIKLLNSLSVELSKERKMRETLERQVKEIMKHKNRESFSDHEREDEIDLDKLKTDRSAQIQRNHRVEVRRNYSPILQKGRKSQGDKNNFHRYGSQNQTVYKRVQYNEFEEKVFEQIDSITDKIRQLEHQMNESEDRIMKYQLEKEIKEKQRMIASIEAENRRLRQSSQIPSQEPNSFLQKRFPFLITLLVVILVIIIASKPEKTCH